MRHMSKIMVSSSLTLALALSAGLVGCGGSNQTTETTDETAQEQPAQSEDATQKGVWVPETMVVLHEVKGGEVAFENTITYTYELDEKGNITNLKMSSVSVSDGEASTPYENSYAYTYDEHGNVTSITPTSKDDDLSTPKTMENEYNEKGLMVSSKTTRDNGWLESETTYEYDASGALIKETSTYFAEEGMTDVKEDGTTVALTNTVQTTSYDAKGNVLEIVSVTNYGDGTSESYSSTNTYEYDAAGNAVSGTASNSYDEDKSAITFEYDANGKKTKETYTLTKEDGSQIIDETTYTYKMIENPSDAVAARNA